MPDWIKRNEDINYLQEGREKPRAWATLVKYNITHLVVDDNDYPRYACFPATTPPPSADNRCHSISGSQFGPCSV